MVASQILQSEANCHAASYFACFFKANPISMASREPTHDPGLTAGLILTDVGMVASSRQGKEFQMSYIPEVLKDYAQLVAKVDQTVERLYKLHERHLVCKAGCDGCCQYKLTFLPVEATWIGFSISGLSRRVGIKIMRRLADYEVEKKTSPCPLLDEDGRCLVYEVRPLLCRTHGLLLRQDGEGEDAERVERTCDLNYQGVDLSQIDPTEMLSQNLLSTLLYQVNGLFAHRVGMDPAQRVELTELPNFLYPDFLDMSTGE